MNFCFAAQISQSLPVDSASLQIVYCKINGFSYFIGAEMYNSRMIQWAQFAEIPRSKNFEMIDVLVIRANINASMRQELQ